MKKQAENLKFTDAELVRDETLDEVVGGHAGDRLLATFWVMHYYGKEDGTHGKIIDTSNCAESEFIAAFCAKAGVDYRMNFEELDQFKINGEWRDANWMIANKEETLAFFDKKLGITK